MRRHSDTYVAVWLLGAVLALWLLTNTIIRNLFYGLIKNWFEKYTGIQEAQVISGLGQIVFALLASGGVVWLIYQITRREFERLYKPALKCTFDMKDAGCVHRNIKASIIEFPSGKFLEERRCDWYRLRIDAEGRNVLGCHARLISVERDGEFVFGGDSPPLPIAHFGESDATINRGVPEYADLLGVYENNTVDLYVPVNRRSLSVDWGNLFSRPGNYQIKDAIVAPDSEPALINLIFKWNVDRATVEIACARSQ